MQVWRRDHRVLEGQVHWRILQPKTFRFQSFPWWRFYPGVWCYLDPHFFANYRASASQYKAKSGELLALTDQSRRFDKSWRLTVYTKRWSTTANGNCWPSLFVDNWVGLQPKQLWTRLLHFLGHAVWYWWRLGHNRRFFSSDSLGYQAWPFQRLPCVQSLQTGFN